MGRGIDLNYHPHSPRFSVFVDLLDLVGRVRSSQTAILTQLWNFWDLERETLLVDDMPVQDVHLVVHQGVDLVLDGCDREEVSG